MSPRSFGPAESLRLLQAANLGVLAGRVAHEFNNVLSGLSGTATVALAHEDPADLRKALRDVVEHARTAGRPLDWVMEFLRGGRGRVEGHTLEDVLTDCVRLLRPFLAKERVDVAVCPGETVPAGEPAEWELHRQLVFHQLLILWRSLPRGGTITARTRENASWRSLHMTARPGPDGDGFTRPPVETSLALEGDRTGFHLCEMLAASADGDLEWQQHADEDGRPCLSLAWRLPARCVEPIRTLGAAQPVPA